MIMSIFDLTDKNTVPDNTSEYENIIAVTNRSICSHPFLEQIERVCMHHPKALILREKDLSEEDYILLADPVIKLCRQYEVLCIPHSYTAASRKLLQPHIHLPLPLLRQYQGTLTDFKTIGCSVHSVQQAQEAQALGATYLTAGHIYATDCKKGLPPRGLDFLEEVCDRVEIPVYAIGGIHPGTGQLSEVMAHKAAGACIMSDMMNI